MMVFLAVCAFSATFANGVSPNAGGAVHDEPSGHLAITLAGSAVLSVIDPLGRRLFYDADSLRYVSEIPNTMAEQGSDGATEDSAASPPSDRIAIPNALDGKYRIEVIAQGAGRFGMSIVAYDVEGGVTGWSDTGTTFAGSHDVYVVRFSSQPGMTLQVRKVYRGGAQLEITMAGTAALTITDPLDRMVRYDADNDEYVSEIPHCAAERKVFVVPAEVSSLSRTRLRAATGLM